MRLITTTAISLFLTGFIFAQTNENANESIKKCALAESISAEFKGASSTAVLAEDSVRNKLKAKKTGDILDDVSTYADIFEQWAAHSVPDFDKQFKQSKDQIKKSKSLTEKEKAFKLAWLSHDLYEQYSYPVSRYGSIIGIEMIEIANRHETNATPYLKRIAAAELPKALGVPTCARVKHQYQNPAAEAWLKLTMPKDMPVTDAKVWLTNFLAEEKAKGADKKEWAVEAGERMLRKMEKESQPSASSNVVTNVPK